MEGTRKQGTYRTTNGAAYSAALKPRGPLTIWLDRDMQWLAEPGGEPGRNPTFYDAASERVMARSFAHRVVERHVRVALLDRFTALGAPVTVAVA